MVDAHYIKDRLQPVKPILESLVHNLVMIKSTALDFGKCNDQCATCAEVKRVDSVPWATDAQEKCASYQRNTAFLYQKCESTIDILCKRLEFTDKGEVQKQSGYLLQLNKSAVDDSVAVRVITFITLVYLSCTVVGVSRTAHKIFKERGLIGANVIDHHGHAVFRCRA